MLLRLQKIIAQAGIASRRHAEELIRSGQVRVNGAIVTELGSKADPDHDRVEVAGRVAEIPEERVYVLLNKPPDVVSTLADPEGRPTLRNFLRGMPERVFPIGRLDYFASGLLLLTNDGELTARVLRASSRLRQTYWIKVKGRISDAEMLEAGRAASADFAPLKGPWARRSAENPWYEVELTGASRDALGRALKRQDHPIEKMKRVQLASLDLDNVPEGHYRRLEPDEIDKFSRVVDRTLAEQNAPAAPAPFAASPKEQRPAAPPNIRPLVAPPINRPPLAARFIRPQQKPCEPWRARNSGPPARNKSDRPSGATRQPRPGAPIHRPASPEKREWRPRNSGPWRGNKTAGPPRPHGHPQPGAPTNRSGAPAKPDWRDQKPGPWRGNKTSGPPRPQGQQHTGAPTKPDWRDRKPGAWRGNKPGGPPGSHSGPPRSQNNFSQPGRPGSSPRKQGRRPDRGPRAPRPPRPPR
jgi:23S rRNA pseudouridine2605 synthase